METIISERNPRVTLISDNGYHRIIRGDNTALPTFAKIPYKDILFVWGIEEGGRNNKLKIQEIHYPHHEREHVEALARQHVLCRSCVEGVQILYEGIGSQFVPTKQEETTMIDYIKQQIKAIPAGLKRNRTEALGITTEKVLMGLLGGKISKGAALLMQLGIPATAMVLSKGTAATVANGYFGHVMKHALYDAIRTLIEVGQQGHGATLSLEDGVRDLIARARGLAHLGPIEAVKRARDEVLARLGSPVNLSRIDITKERILPAAGDSFSWIRD